MTAPLAKMFPVLNAGSATALHLAAWAVLSCGIWLEWRWAMVAALLTIVANLTTFFLPVAGTALALLAVLPFAQRSIGLANTAIFLLGATGFQLWVTFTLL